MAIEYHYGQFPPSKLDWERIIPFIGPANAAIAHFDGIMTGIPNSDVLLAPLTTQEAVLSSRIEGTQTTMGEVLEYEVNANNEKFRGERKNDIFEVLNYRGAIHEAERLLDTIPLSQRLLKNIHQTLLSGVRGENRSPGEYRKIPNWIGAPGRAVEEALFAPISPDKLAAGMDAWEAFIHRDFPDKLVQLALLHVEFEALHPFLDGNGRLGRIFIPIYLWQFGIINRPNFYISEFFESHKDVYYEKLRDVSGRGAWTDWCVFFLEALKTQANDNSQKAQKIINLYEKMKRTIPSIINSRYALQIIEGLFRSPIFNTSGFGENNNISGSAVRRIMPILLEEGIIKVIEEGSGTRATTYMFPELLSIEEGREF